MDVQEILKLADKLVFSKTGKHLEYLEEAILRGTIQGQKYSQIAEDSHLSEVILGMLLVNYGKYFRIFWTKMLVKQMFAIS